MSGILVPRIDSGEMLMKLAAVGQSIVLSIINSFMSGFMKGTLKDHLVGEQSIAEYILHVLNEQSILKSVTVQCSR